MNHMKRDTRLKINNILGIVIFAGIMAVSVLVSLLLLIPGRVFVLKSDNKNSKMI